MFARPGRTVRLPFSLAIVLPLLLSAAACSNPGGTPPYDDIADPVFSNPVGKIAQTGDVEGFSRTLYDQYVYQDTGLVDAAQPLAVYMAFFGGPNNRGRAVHARAFVQGVGRTSAFWTECRTIRRLMEEGHVADFLCAGTDFPSYRVTTAPDWVEYPADCQPPP